MSETTPTVTELPAKEKAEVVAASVPSANAALKSQSTQIAVQVGMAAVAGAAGAIAVALPNVATAIAALAPPWAQLLVVAAITGAAGALAAFSRRHTVNAIGAAVDISPENVPMPPTHNDIQADPRFRKAKVDE